MWWISGKTGRVTLCYCWFKRLCCTSYLSVFLNENVKTLTCVKGNKQENNAFERLSCVSLLNAQQRSLQCVWGQGVKRLNVKVLKPSGTFKLLLIVWACGYLVLLFKMTFSVFFYYQPPFSCNQGQRSDGKHLEQVSSPLHCSQLRVGRWSPDSRDN